jgi:hypothetical protein
MTKQQKIALSASRDIPFNKLMLSQSDVRHVKAGVSIEELAEDIARRTLLAAITVRPVLDGDGAETGMYTIPAGGRRFRALELLVKQKRMNKTAMLPCIVRTDGPAEEDSLAENVQRAPLRPDATLPPRTESMLKTDPGPSGSTGCAASVTPECRDGRAENDAGTADCPRPTRRSHRNRRRLRSCHRQRAAALPVEDGQPANAHSSAINPKWSSRIRRRGRPAASSIDTSKATIP